MAQKSFAKFVLVGFSLLIIGVTSSFAQGESCGLRIEVSQNDNDAAISGATATAVNTETKKIYRSALRKGLPFFARLSEGEYKITVIKTGYKKSLAEYVVTCVQMDNGVITTSIPMWRGSSRQVVAVSEEYQTTEPQEYYESNSEASKIPPMQNGGGADVQASSDIPKSTNGGFINGKARNLVKPEYPAAAITVRAAGAVNVQVTIDEEGNIISAAAVSGHPLLRAAAVKAARESKFPPTLLDGKPVKVTGIIVYNFVP